MTNKLFKLLQRPALWQRSAESLWDDEHISKGMLAAHLNPDLESASRKHSDIDRSVAWLAGVIPANAKVLDLGCGPGLYTKRLSDMGYDVTGMDLSPRSIAYAQSQDAKTEYVCKSYLEMDYNAAFDAITLIYYDFAALTPDERRVLLTKIAQALKPGGLFILDVNTVEQFENKTETTAWTLCNDGGYWSAKPYICLEATYLYENKTVMSDQYIVVTQDGIKEYRVWFCAYTAQTLTDEVSPFGFKAVGLYDDVCGSPLTDTAESLCAILQK